MIKAYIDFWKRAFDFSGRSTRPDYWWAYLVNVIIITILTVFCVLIVSRKPLAVLVVPKSF